MASYTKLSSIPLLDNIGDLSLDEMIFEYISNASFRDLFQNRLNIFVQFVRQRQLDDGFFKRVLFLGLSKRDSFKDNLRNHINGYDMSIELIVSGFEDGILNPALDIEFLEGLLCQKDYVKHTGREKFYRLTLNKILLDIMPLHDIGEDLTIALVERMKIKGYIKIRTFTDKTKDNYSQSFYLIHLINIALGLSYFRLSEILLRSYPHVHKYGFDLFHLLQKHDNQYTCFDKIIKCSSIYVLWNSDTSHHRNVYNFLSNFYQKDAPPSLKLYDPDKESIETLIY